MGNLKKCGACNRYTLQETCPACCGTVRDPEPPKFSFPDKYGEYRREAKRGGEDDDRDA